MVLEESLTSVPFVQPTALPIPPASSPALQLLVTSSELVLTHQKFVDLRYLNL